MGFELHSWVLWVGIIAAGLHLLDEYGMGWLTWVNQGAGRKLGISVSRTDFFLGGALLLFFTLAAAAIGWWAPAISLAVPALFVLNAVFFHMLPSARSEKPVPGTLSAVLIYLPVAIWMYWAASADGVLSFGTVLLSYVIAAALLAYPIAILMLKPRLGWTEADAVRSRSAAADSDHSPSGKPGDAPDHTDADESGFPDPGSEDSGVLNTEAYDAEIHDPPTDDTELLDSEDHYLETEAVGIDDPSIHDTGVLDTAAYDAEFEDPPVDDVEDEADPDVEADSESDT